MPLGVNAISLKKLGTQQDQILEEEKNCGIGHLFGIFSGRFCCSRVEMVLFWDFRKTRWAKING